MTEFLAADVDHFDFVTVPVPRNELKQRLRDGLSTFQARQYWWPVLAGLNTSDAIVSEYPDYVATASRLQGLLNEPLLSAQVDPDDPLSLDTVSRNVMYVLHNSKKLSTAELPFLEPMIRILVSVLLRADVCYLTVTDLLANQNKYIEPNLHGYRVMLYSFREMVKSFMPKTFKDLNNIGALDDKYLNLIFVG
jgi:hypothetical protein